MIVAAKAGGELRHQMESVVPCQCRRCEAELAADSRTIRLAAELPCRRGRPIKFFCVACCVLHDHASIDELHDHRPPTPATAGGQEPTR